MKWVGWEVKNNCLEHKIMYDISIIIISFKACTRCLSIAKET